MKTTRKLRFAVSGVLLMSAPMIGCGGAEEVHANEPLHTSDAPVHINEPGEEPQEGVHVNEPMDTGSDDLGADDMGADDPEPLPPG